MLATKAKKHPAPKHPEAEHAKPDHPKPDHPKPQKATVHKSPHATHSAKKSKLKRKRGQQAIDGERARQIQAALIREHYIKGEPSGAWDSSTQEAMRRYQADQGWQTKEVPDSRALIRLGLGPDHGRLLNPESAMMTGPATPARSSARLGSVAGSNSSFSGTSSTPASAGADLSPAR